MARILIESGDVCLQAELGDTPTVGKLLAVLPCEAVANTWGEEVYFPVPVSTELEADAEQVVPAGTVGFWVEGSSLALPYGPTPISKSGECRLAARVNILGRVIDDPGALGRIRAGDPIRVSLIDD